MRKIRFAVAATLFATGLASAAVIDGATVVASQGGQNLTYSDIDQAVDKVPQVDRAHFIDSPKRIQSLILNLLLQKQLAEDAVKTGLDKSPEIEAATGVDKIKLLADAQLAHFRESVTIPDLSALAQEEYIAHKEKYVAEENVEVQQVFVSTASRTSDEAKKIAEQVETEAKSGTVEFDALVAKYSDEPTKVQTLGIIKSADKRAVNAELSKAIGELVIPGTLSPPVETAGGYYVLKLLARTPQRQLSFDEARDQIISLLKSEYVKKQVADYVDGLRNNPLDADPDKIEALRTRYGTVPVAPPAGTPAPATKEGPKKSGKH